MLRWVHTPLNAAIALGAVMVIASLSGCAGGGRHHVDSNPYAVAAEPNAQLLALAAQQTGPLSVNAVTSDDPLRTSWNCRGYGHVSTPGYTPAELYIRDALRDELAQAKLYSPNGPTALRVERLEISLFTMFAGSWTFSGRFAVGESPPFEVRHKHAFGHQAQPASACSSAAIALPLATREFLHAVFAHPDFQKGMTSYPKGAGAAREHRGQEAAAAVPALGRGESGAAAPGNVAGGIRLVYSNRLFEDKDRESAPPELPNARFVAGESWIHGTFRPIEDVARDFAARHGADIALIRPSVPNRANMTRTRIEAWRSLDGATSPARP